MESTTRIDSVDDPGLPSEQPTEVRPAVIAGGRELCSNCAAPLAADQRYCTECGQRRGAPRFPFMQDVTQRQRQAEAPPPRHRPRFTANSTLIAGIGTLLLAMGIGVLIGRTGNNSGSKAAAPVQVVTVAGGGASGAAGASSAATSTPTRTTSAASAAKGAATAKATHTSTKGTFTTKAPPPKVTTVGGSCTGSGNGCQGGKFTGNFFGQ